MACQMLPKSKQQTVHGITLVSYLLSPHGLTRCRQTCIGSLDEHDGQVDVHLHLCSCRTEEAQQLLTSKTLCPSVLFCKWCVCLTIQVMKQWLQRHSSVCWRCAVKSSHGQLKTPASRQTATASMLVQGTMLQTVHPGNR